MQWNDFNHIVIQVLELIGVLNNLWTEIELNQKKKKMYVEGVFACFIYNYFFFVVTDKNFFLK